MEFADLHYGFTSGEKAARSRWSSHWWINAEIGRSRFVCLHIINQHHNISSPFIQRFNIKHTHIIIIVYVILLLQVFSLLLLSCCDFVWFVVVGVAAAVVVVDVVIAIIVIGVVVLFSCIFLSFYLQIFMICNTNINNVFVFLAIIDREEMLQFSFKFHIKSVLEIPTTLIRTAKAKANSISEFWILIKTFERRNRTAQSPKSYNFSFQFCAYVCLFDGDIILLALKAKKKHINKRIEI